MRFGELNLRHGEAWHLVSGPGLRDALPGAWRSGNGELNSAHPALDWRYICLLHKYFGEPTDVLASSEFGLALLRPYGYGRWTTFLPSQACVGSVLVAPGLDGPTVSDAFHSLSRSLPGLTTMLSLRKQDAAIAQLQSSHSGKTFSQSVYGVTTAVDATQPFDTFWQARPKSLRQSVRRRFRKVEKEQVRCHTRIFRCAGEMTRAIADHANLEQSGWKGRQGTALDGSNLQSQFYLELMTEFAAEGQAAAYQLLFDDDVKASLLTIQAGGTLIVLKTAYDDASSRFAPGRLLDYLFLQEVCNDPDITVVENYTDASEEDRRWCTSCRNIVEWDYFPFNIIRTMTEARRTIRSRFRKD